MRIRPTLVLDRAAAVAALIGLAAGGLRARPQQPTFRARTDVVSVDVLVTDDLDRPVRSLVRRDFTILDGGRPQAIVDLEAVSIPVASRDLGQAVGGTSSDDIVTNTVRADRGRLFAVVIDDLHLIEGQIPAVQQVLRTFVRGLSDADEAAVVFAGRSDLSENFTSDAARLLAARRQPELAVRMALGASRRHLVRACLGGLLAAAAAGIAAGLAAGVALGREAATMLYAVGAADVRVIGGVLAVVALAALAGGAAPAGRVLRLDVASILRRE